MNQTLMVFMGIALLLVGFSELPNETHSIMEILFFGGWNTLVFLFIASNIRQWLVIKSNKRNRMVIKQINPRKKELVRKMGRVRPHAIR